MRKPINNNYFINISIILLFIITFLLVEFSQFGSHAVALYNKGYGTFDMKYYNISTIHQVLSTMKPKGFEVYNNYLLADYIFIITFACFQILLSKIIFSTSNCKLIYKLSIIIPILRGVFDFIENTTLKIILNNYPNINNFQVNISSISTQCKLWCIKIWFILILVGIFTSIFTKNRKITS